jgi:fido (protein-threonine AMPylation protein)
MKTGQISAVQDIYFPSASTLTPTEHLLLAAIEKCFAEIPVGGVTARTPGADKLEMAVRNQANLLEDGLLALLPPSRDVVICDHTSEHDAVRSQIRPFKNSLRNRSLFRGWLEAIHRGLATRGPSWRTTEMRTNEDGGVPVKYYAPSKINYALESLRTYICAEKYNGHPALTAIVAYNVLLQIHPFMDGNGRVARILFNMILNDNLSILRYIPLKFPSSSVNSSLALKLNRTRIERNYEHLMKYILGSLNCAKEMYLQSQFEESEFFQ